MFIRNRKSLNAAGVAVCFSCFGLSELSAAGPSLLTSQDEARERSVVTSRQGTKLVEGHTTAGSDPQSESLLSRSEAAPAQLLDDEELVQLAVRAEEPGENVVGGALNNQQLTYVAIALAAAVVVLIAK